MNAPRVEGSDNDALVEGPGRQLKRAREAANLSIGEISARLHLDVKTVRAIEADDYSTLPAPAFVRGYLRGYARMLNVPVEPLVASFDVHGLAPPPLVADISEDPQAQSSDFPVQLITWLIILGLAVLVFLWWRGQVFSSDPTPGAIGSATEPAGGQRGLVVSGTDASGNPGTSQVGSVASGSGQSGLTLPGPAGAGSSDITLLPDTTSSAAGSVPANAASSGSADGIATDPAVQAAATLTGTSESPTATGLEAGANSVQAGAAGSGSTPEASSAPGPGAATEGAAADGADSTGAAATSEPSGTEVASGTDGDGSSNTASAGTESEGTAADAGAGEEVDVTLKLGQDSWVEVYDRNNNKLYWNLARRGRELNLRGESPVRVLLGKTKRVEVLLNGEAVDFRPFMARGVARFLLTPAGPAAVPAEPESETAETSQ